MAKKNETPLTPLEQALKDMLWDVLRRDPEHKDRRKLSTQWGTKTVQGLTKSIVRVVREHGDDSLINDLWWFIENATEDMPDRTERFFALRERVRTMPVCDAVAKARAYDARLDAAERVPTGDDYNAIMEIIGVQS